MKHAITILRREIGVSEARLAILKMDGVADEIPDVLDAIRDMRAAIEQLEKLPPPPHHVDYVAGYLYDSYRAGVGGVAFNGDPLPMWHEFSEDPAKVKQAEAWRHVARSVLPALRDDAETLEKALARDFNRFSVDAHLGTPDFVLAKAAVRFITLMETATDERAKWFGQHIDPETNPELPGFDADLDEPLPAPQACRDGETCDTCQ